MSPDDALRGRIARCVAQASGARSISVGELRRLGGGAIQDNYALDLEIGDGPQAGRYELVARLDAPARVEASLTRSQEFAVLRVAHDAGVPVPEPMWLCRGEADAERPFYLMRRAPGIALAHRLVRDRRLDAQVRSALVHRLGAELARLHRLRPPHPQLGFLALPSPSPALERVGRYRRWLDALDEARPALEWALRWLERNAPPAGHLSLVHGDYRTGNYLVNEGRLSAILDWEFTAWGDPAEDLGWFCARCWRFGAWEHEAGGMGSRADFYAGYASVSGTLVATDAIGYWEVMAAVRWAVIALQQGWRHWSGAQPSLELALTGRMAAQMEFDALQLIEKFEREGRAG